MAERSGGERRNREAECAGIGEDCGAGEDEHVLVDAGAAFVGAACALPDFQDLAGDPHFSRDRRKGSAVL